MRTLIIVLFWLVCCGSTESQNLSPIRTFAGHDFWVRGVAFSTKGLTLVTGGGSQLLIWDVETATSLRRITAHSDYISAVAISPSGEWVASGAWDNHIRIWSVQEGSQVKELRGHTKPITGIAFSSDGRYLISASRDESIRIWSTSGWAFLVALDGEAPITSAALARGGAKLAAGDEKGNVLIWDFPAGTNGRILDIHGRATKSVSFSSDDRFLVSAGDDKNIVLVDVSSMKVVNKFPEQEYPITAVSFTPNDQHIIAVDQGGQINVFDVLSRIAVHSSRSSSKILSMGLSYDGHYLVTGHDNSNAYLWDLDQIQALRESRSLPADLVTNIAFDDGSSLFPNKALDAGETARATITITNKGNGVAFDVLTKVSCDAPGLTYPHELAVGEISVGQSKSVDVSLQANLSVRESRATVRIQTSEKRGYDARAISLDLPVHELKPPDLKIVSVEVNDKTAGLASGNGNGIIENSETVELSILVRNQGVGEAHDARLALVSITDGVDKVQDEDALGDIPVGKTVRGRVVFTVPRFFKQSVLQYSLKVSEVRGVGTTQKTESKEVQNQQASLALETGSPQPTLTNGMSSAIQISISNSGKLKARNVNLAISASPSSAQLSVPGFRIGEIGSGGKSSPKVVEITLPRKFTEKSVLLNFELTQDDFPGNTDRRVLPVALLQPELKLIAEPLKKIQQGETGFLEIGVSNAGRLTAEDVVATLRTDKLTIEGEKSRSFGRLSPNSTSDLWRVRYHALRNLAPGSLPIEVVLREREFPMSVVRLDYQIVEEAALMTRVEAAKTEKSIPISASPSDVPLISSSLADSQTVSIRSFDFKGSTSAERGIQYVVATLNASPIYDSRQQTATAERLQRTRGKLLDFEFRIPDLRVGINEVEITVYDRENEFTKKVVKIFYSPERVASRVTLDQSIDIEDVSRMRRGDRNPDGVAVVIGIEKYQSLPSALFADKDAAAMERYLVETFGFSRDNIVLLLNEEGTLSNIRKELLGKRLENRIVQGRTDLFVFFSGHGFPNVSEKAMYIAPYDCDKTDIDQTGIALNELFRRFKSLKARAVTVVLDACFSGYEKGRPDRFLIAAKPVALVIESPELLLQNSSVFYSSSGEQISSWIQDKKHSIFTYYYLKGLQGEADANGNDEITVGELESYLQSKVPREARTIGIEQTPQVRASDKLRVLVKY